MMARQKEVEEGRKQWMKRWMESRSWEDMLGRSAGWGGRQLSMSSLGVRIDLMKPTQLSGHVKKLNSFCCIQSFIYALNIFQKHLAMYFLEWNWWPCYPFSHVWLLVISTSSTSCTTSLSCSYALAGVSFDGIQPPCSLSAWLSFTTSASKHNCFL